jgi:hypothetical protein
MPRLQPLLVAAVMAWALAVPPAGARTPLQAARQAFEAELGRQCPAQHLENMTAGDLDGLMESFQTRFTPPEIRQVQDAVGLRCARIEAGLTCGNNASLEVYRRQARLKAFVREACASGWSCKAFADCVLTRP